MRQPEETAGSQGGRRGSARRGNTSVFNSLCLPACLPSCLSGHADRHHCKQPRSRSTPRHFPTGASEWYSSTANSSRTWGACVSRLPANDSKKILPGTGARVFHIYGLVTRAPTIFPNLSSFLAPPPPPPPPPLSPSAPHANGTKRLPNRSAHSLKKASVEIPAAARRACAASPPSLRRTAPSSAATLVSSTPPPVAERGHIAAVALRARASSCRKATTLDSDLPAAAAWCGISVASAKLAALPSSWPPNDVLRRRRSSKSRTRLVERNICKEKEKKRHERVSKEGGGVRVRVHLGAVTRLRI